MSTQRFAVPEVGGGGGGGVEQAVVEAVVLGRLEVLPAASYASTASVYVVPHARPPNV